MNTLKAIPRLVVKFGTESISIDGKLSQGILDGFADEIIKVNQLGTEVVIVSSGAIRTGEEAISALGLKTDCFEKKHIASIGARHLMAKWGRAFCEHNREVAQILVTYASLTHTGERESTKSSILRYLEHGVVPVVNENDVLSDEEIRWMEQGISENDNLTQQIAFLVEADAVLFITNERGVYKEDPKNNPEAEIYTKIYCDDILACTSNSSSSKGGTGGMETKLNAAVECAKAGKRVCIVGQEQNMIIRFVKGTPIGTSIVNR